MSIFKITTTNKWKIKLFLLAFALIIVTLVMFYSNLLVSELIEREKKSIEFYADVYRRYTNPNANIEELDLLVSNLSNLIQFPIIMTDENDNPIYPFDSYTLNIKFNKKWGIEEKRNYLKNLINKMKNEYPPIVIFDYNGQVFAKFYYSHSSLIERLKFFPLIEIVISIAFITFAYIAYKNLKKSEESKLWFGMAREAAHQLGTPLSSLLAWLELLKDKKGNILSQEEVIDEMEQDIQRLQTISERFAKIGSQPERKRENLVELINNVINYFEKRVPQKDKKISIFRQFPTDIVLADVNTVLFTWVIENLLKNAIESIDSKEGWVKITIKTTKRKVIILVSDNGRGMNLQQKRLAFQPGYTTKRRGWGIGLTFCKRIVEDYHDSKIYIKETSPGKGTTFAIELPNKFPNIT
ncbi:MAG: HAMP domain-containing histidine kinase [Ignavibacteria bacterium]|nr:HAMP domain-containing histidine kinase [Ignavibacteria bacterium]